MLTNLKVKTLSLLSSFIVAIILCELVARFAYPLYQDYQSEFWRYGRDLKVRSGDPDLGHEHRPGQGSYYGVEIKIGELGQRLTGHESTTSGEPKILLVGDSLALGWGVEAKKSYAGLVQKKLNEDFSKINLLNLSVGNYGIRNKYGVIKKFLETKSMNIKAIILEFHINDVEEILYPSAVELFFINHSYLYAQLLRQWKHYKISDFLNYYETKYTSSGLTHVQSYLQKIEQLTIQAKVPLMIFIIPDLHQLKPYPFKELTQKIFSHLHPQTKLIDSLSVLAEFSPSEIWLDNQDIHPNEFGHQLLYDVLWKELKTSVDKGWLVLETTDKSKAQN